MGLLRSLYAGVSGLRNHQVMLDVIGNNIANVNTIGFKVGRVTFSEMFAQTLRGTTQPLANLGGTNPMQVGLGMSLNSIDTLFSQGTIETTGQVTDLAIQGNGFFILSDGEKRVFTRAGGFQFDANGYLVSPSNGLRVQGFLANKDGIIEAGTPISDIRLPLDKKIAANATSRIDLAGNLDASAEPLGTILKSTKLFAVEKAGDGSDIEGLYAKGNANEVISGMIPNSTTITITDSVVGTKTYKYVAADTAVGNGAFNSLDDLIAEINNDFGGTSFTASLNADGAIVFTDVSGGTNVLTIESNNPILNQALRSANGDLSAGSRLTDEFSHVANENDLLVDLRDENGNRLGVQVGDEITINGLKGGDPLTEYAFTVSATTTYKDFAAEIETALGLTNKDGVQISTDDGALVIYGDGGKAYELSGLDIRADDTPGTGGTPRTGFNNIFDSTPGHYQELQKAQDAQQSSSITIYDSQGNSFDLTIIFTKDVVQPNRWKWEVRVPDAITATGGSEGYIEFNPDGSLKSFRYLDGSSSLQLATGDNGTDLISIELNPGELGGFEGITQFSGANSNVLIVNQDGYGMGTLERIAIDQFGNISGIFSNGVVQLLGQIALANFNNPGGLFRTEDNLFLASGNSGDPILTTAGAGINATIISGALEQSNVDLAEEFTKMIVAQRGFQANARIITTSDDLLAEVTNLKR